MKSETISQGVVTVVNLLTDIQELIENAREKAGLSSKKELCRYLPGNTPGHYMHHFTFRKYAQNDPEALAKLIKTHVMDMDNPRELPPAPRRPRGIRKRTRSGMTAVEVSQKQLNDLILLVKEKNNRELEEALTSQLRLLPVHTIKKQLIRGIRDDAPDRGLFEAFCSRLED